MTHTVVTPRRIHARKGFFAMIATALGQFARRRRDRSKLAQLDPHLLRDIGLDAVTAAEECAKPFWRP